jgi:hypothetical protein
MPAQVCEAVLQLVLSWLAVAVSRLPAANYKSLSIICNVFCAFHADSVSTGTSDGFILAGSGSIQAAGCGTFHIDIRSNPAGIFLVSSGSIQAAGCGTVHIGIRSNPDGIILDGSGSVRLPAAVLFTLASEIIQLASF